MKNYIYITSPSNGILLRGNSNNYGSTINIQSKNLLWDTSTCVLDITLDSNTNDITWLHPNNELNIINTSSTATLYIYMIKICLMIF